MSTQTLLDCGIAALLRRPESVEIEELRRDMAAVGLAPFGAADTSGFDRDAILTRPNLLRRIAAFVATHVPPTTDRLVAELDDATLAAAVALHTGLPFVLVEPAALPESATEATLHGELHPSEAVVAISLLRPSSGLLETMDSIRASVLIRVAVINEGTELGQTVTDVTSLFACIESTTPSSLQEDLHE